MNTLKYNQLKQLLWIFCESYDEPEVFLGEPLFLIQER